MSQPEILRLDDDGVEPNNPQIPVMVYRGQLLACGRAPEQGIIARFAANGWGGAWINGIYAFHHYHASSHEVLGLARGWVEVQLGGSGGPVVKLAAGDAVLIPAGVGHCRLAAAADLSVVGAYPAGQEDPDLRRATAENRSEALGRIPRVTLPALDPVLGTPLGPEGASTTMVGRR